MATAESGAALQLQQLQRNHRRASQQQELLPQLREGTSSKEQDGKGVYSNDTTKKETAEGRITLPALDARTRQIFSRFQMLISLHIPKFRAERDWLPEHTISVLQFLDPRPVPITSIIVAYPDPHFTASSSSCRILVSRELPTFPVSHLYYFLRCPDAPPAAASQHPAVRDASDDAALFDFSEAAHAVRLTVISKMQCGSIVRPVLAKLASLMNDVYIPLLSDAATVSPAANNNTVAIEATKNANGVRSPTVTFATSKLASEFASQMHKFMATLTDTLHYLQDQTVLYVPREKIPDSAFASKDLVQRFEALLIHWIRQIKRVVSAQNTSEASENAGPLEEIRFWESRCEKLSGIHSQINRVDVQSILRLLETTKSTNLDQFVQLSKLIQDELIQAHKNLRFISILRDLCTTLSHAEPQDIPALLPNLLVYLRIIYENSRFFGNKERITNLFRRVSNEIIRRCCAMISLGDVFHSDLTRGINSLHKSIACGESWKAHYRRCAQHVAANSDRKWDFDESSIFAQVDAFVQRCRDLLEVCEGQMQFARKIVRSSDFKGAPAANPGSGSAPDAQFSGGLSDSSKGAQSLASGTEKPCASQSDRMPIPIFAGTKGPEIERSLQEIERSFERRLSVLWEIKDYILDVKATRWHDDYNTFKQGMKDLEVMFQNVINTAFESSKTVDTDIELLEIFSGMAIRDGIKRTVERKTSELLQRFLKELQWVKTYFEAQRKAPEVLATHPKYAGAAFWAHHLLCRVRVQFNTILDSSDLLLDSSGNVMTQVQSQFASLQSALEEYITKLHHEWVLQLDKSIISRLHTSLMARRPDGYLEMKFSTELLKLNAEIHLWQRLKYDIPYYVHEAYNKREELRVLRENVQLVVRDYNSVLEALSSDEILLFKERIRFLDRKIHPGLGGLMWDSKFATEYYLAECLRQTSDLQKTVSWFIDANRSLYTCFKQFSEMCLCHVEQKRVYEIQEFESAQLVFRQSATARLKSIHAQIAATLQKTYETFKADGKEVQKQWSKFLQRLDVSMEASLRVSVRRSLQELLKAINDGSAAADARVEAQPLFKIDVVLEGTKVEFAPPLTKLQDLVISTARTLMELVTVVPRLQGSVPLAEMQMSQDNATDIVPQVSAVSTTTQSRPGSGAAALTLSLSPNKKPTFYEAILADEDMNKIIESMRTGMEANFKQCSVRVKNWDSYREIWEINKDAFIRRYAKLKPAMSTFDADINRYNEVANNAQKEETLNAVGFIRLDCSSLKHTIVAHCHTWQSKLTTLLNNIAQGELKNLVTTFRGLSAKLVAQPTNLQELEEKMILVSKLQNDLLSIEGQFAPLQEQYLILQKYEVQISAEERSMLESLPVFWSDFKTTLHDSTLHLRDVKEKFKNKVLADLDELKARSATILDDLHARGPYTSGVTNERAVRLIADFMNSIREYEKAEETVIYGLRIFELQHVPMKSIPVAKQELRILSRIWDLHELWDSFFSEWRGLQCLEFDQQEAERKVSGFMNDITGLQKEAQKEWEIITHIKDKVQQVRKLIPVLVDLRNPALRDRHWEQLSVEIGRAFDPTSKLATVERALELSLDQHAESICAMSGAASKELSVEQSLVSIKQAWARLAFQILPFKEKYLRVAGSEEVFELLEDNQLTLSSLKASKYYASFSEQIDHWEQTLACAIELFDLLLQTQKNWAYLESIFVGAEDIRKQMPKESAVFDLVNASWCEILRSIKADKLVLHAVQNQELIDTLHDLFGKLEKVQRSLDMYLETKRQFFPRFYFLSNDDLLEILGQAKDPFTVQKHMRKCFDGIQSLSIQTTGPEARQRHTAIGMQSPDGEYVPFATAVEIEGAVEDWLTVVENAMRATLSSVLLGCINAIKKSKRDKWINEWPGQLLILASQIQWTSDCTKAIAETEKGERHALKDLRKSQISVLMRFTDLVRTKLSKIDRLKLIALITAEVHSRDIIEKMVRAEVCSSNAFEWLSQLRFYWDKEEDNCVIKQTNTRFKYGHEYLGNGGRLVITPLTDRCFMTLTTALHLVRGGSLQGPAGTGKTETVKELAKALGKPAIIQNCSEGLDYRSMGRMFSGLAQTGAWGCFDEFNRIDIEVLSVVALQIAAILSAIQRKDTTFIFLDHEIRLNLNTGIFITMNPTYAGRVELPDNLKSLFRPIAMMVPDTALIAEIMLFAEGFSNSKVLAKRVDTLYRVCQQQLSKQDHYDFGLRALSSALKTSGTRRRADFSIPDENILYAAMMDTNMPKLTAEDTPHFLGILNDLFPGLEVASSYSKELKSGIVAAIAEQGFQPVDYIVSKVAQLYDTKLCRHAVMLVGSTGSGKSTCWRTLQLALNQQKQDASATISVKTHVLNPKSITLGELYGFFSSSSNEWVDGVLSNIMRTVCSCDKSNEQNWIVFDGPATTDYIESMNSVMDNTKILTLINGERIALTDDVSLIFEVENLAAASPATVSRCGMVYMDYGMLGWRPLIASWIAKKSSQTAVNCLTAVTEKYIPNVLKFRRSYHEKVATHESAAIRTLTVLFDSLVQSDGVSLENARHVEALYQFCIIWALGGTIHDEVRRNFDMFIREIDGQFPSKDTVYDYYFDLQKETWTPWEARLPEGWRYTPGAPFFKIFVPTADSVRIEHIVRSLIKAKQPILLVGEAGVGKTSLLKHAFVKESEQISVLNIPFSAQTTANQLQRTIESKLEKRTKNVFIPVGGKRLLCFVDDLNLPQKDAFGTQPPLEFLQHFLEYGFCFDKTKQQAKYFHEVQIVAAKAPPGGGRSSVGPRVKSRFNILTVASPSEQTLQRIFNSIIGQKLQDFEEELKPLGPLMVQATIELYHFVVGRFLPTPKNLHYIFNYRDISRIFQGLLRSHRDYYDTKDSLVRLWAHEATRVFSDRLVDATDEEAFNSYVASRLTLHFNHSVATLFPAGKMSAYGGFMGSERIYEEISNAEELREHLMERLDAYNQEPGNVQMDLVLFSYAIEHVCRIMRVLGQPGGHVVLIGVGGSGRQSLTTIAAYIQKTKTFSLHISKNYRLQEFRDDMKVLLKQCGCSGIETAFVLSDSQILDESFLEDVSQILSSGEIPSLFENEEVAEIREAMRPIAVSEKRSESAESLDLLFVERVKAYLHIVLCLSPVGEAFRNRLRMFPAILNCASIDWFGSWPEDALLEVATKYLGEISGLDTALISPLATAFAKAHTAVAACSAKMGREVQRHAYVTPISFLEFVGSYIRIYTAKRENYEKLAGKLSSGLKKLDDTKEAVQHISKELEVAKKQVLQFQKQCEEYLVVIVQQKREADDHAKQVSAKSEKLEVEEIEVKAVAEAARADLDQALPALDAATKALESLNKKDLNEIRSYGKPPPLVEKVMEAVMVLKKSDPTWEEAKRQLGNPNFIKHLIGFDKDNVSDRVLKRVSQYCSEDSFQPEIVGKVAGAAKSLCLWVRAIESYSNIFRAVAPKRERLRIAQENLEKKQLALRDAKERLMEVQQKLAQLQQQYDEKVALKEKLKKESEMTETKLSRAEQLVSGLGGERERWEARIHEYEASSKNLVGDCLVAAAFQSYAGPFSSTYRSNLIENSWIVTAKSLDIPFTQGLSVCRFLCEEALLRKWNIFGLPSDNFSYENAILATSGFRWPLMIDPQDQAGKWLRKMEANRGLKVIDAKQPDLIRTLEPCIQFGVPVLLHGLTEVIDPVLDPLLRKSTMKKNGRLVMLLGDKEVDFNPDFILYLTTRLANPNYSPEVFAKTTVINFSVKQEGLEDQLLGVLIRAEKPALEDQKDRLVVSVVTARCKLVALEDRILELLSSAEGSLLEDEQMLNTLKTSKATSEQVAQQLAVSERTEAEINATREQYRPSANRFSVLYFVLNELAVVDPMYQFSLETYTDIVKKSIQNSKRSEDVSTRVELLNQYHTFATFVYASRSLFEKDKLLLVFQMTMKILQAAGKVTQEHFEFLLKGGIVLDREAQPSNPCTEWVTEAMWDNLTVLSGLQGFQSLLTSLEQSEREWRAWFQASEPERRSLPGDWQMKMGDFQRMMLIRAFRQDRIIFCVRNFVSSILGPQYVDPPLLNLKELVRESAPKTPILFILSPGADPLVSLVQLSHSEGMHDKFRNLSLGQGQAPKATMILQEGMRQGLWVFLANCHLSISWMPTLEKLIEDFGQTELHPNFRLWLSSSPNSSFPISILHSSVKVTTEPPKGLRANMIRMYSKTNDEALMSACKKANEFRKLLFSLSYFHSVLLERKKFMSLGWNAPCDFNDSDYDICVSILSSFLDDYSETPWDALRYLIAEANYGGRVTDEWDRRVLKSYINSFFCPEAIKEAKYVLSSQYTAAPQSNAGGVGGGMANMGGLFTTTDESNSNSVYHIPEDKTVSEIKDFLGKWPLYDRPEAFGQHQNADIASQIRESDQLLETLAALRPQLSVGGESGSREDVVLSLVSDLQQKIPENLDYEAALKRFSGDAPGFGSQALLNDGSADTKSIEADCESSKLNSGSSNSVVPSPVSVVLLREIRSYNALLATMRTSVFDLQNAVKGVIVMNSSLEAMFASIYDGNVPPVWGQTYPSLKSLGSWIRDLQQRVAFFAEWITAGEPTLLWLGAFSAPTSLLTAQLQQFARRNGLSIELLGWEFTVVSADSVPGPSANQGQPQQPQEQSIAQSAGNGAESGFYVGGIFLEGAGWDKRNNTLSEPRPMELLTQLPPVHFKPVAISQRRKAGKQRGVYQCPVYYYPVRGVVKERSSFVIAIDLKTAAQQDADFFIKRGTACLLSTK